MRAISRVELHQVLRKVLRTCNKKKLGLYQSRYPNPSLKPSYGPSKQSTYPTPQNYIYSLPMTVYQESALRARYRKGTAREEAWDDVGAGAR